MCEVKVVYAYTNEHSANWDLIIINNKNYNGVTLHYAHIRTNKNTLNSEYHKYTNFETSNTTYWASPSPPTKYITSNIDMYMRQVQTAL